ncbi:L10-interacting MYB domain-containing protein-like [Papaver somniferum]|uniref:L10-interacting MYB domain-containing protein-like n=1 Tax=Papaver somniferum TaxID=3469 RepID=UPI000E702D1B|nr:L10-interacting MYB domain-containing protein-like [Papaver somniferum]
MGSNQSSNPQTGRTTWTPPMDRLFMGLMADQVHEGQLLDGQFSKHAWTHIFDNFRQSFGSSFTKDVLKNRMKTLKKNYVAVSTLRGQSGFGWDQSREVVVADDDVWDEYIKKHPDVKCWRTKSLPHFDDLADIFGDNRANGRYRRCWNDNTVHDDDDQHDRDHENLENTQSPDRFTNGTQEQSENAYAYKDKVEDLHTSDTQKMARASIGPNSRSFRKTKKSTGEW